VSVRFDDGRRQELPTDHGPREEIVLERPFTERVEIDVTCLIARKLQGASGVDQGLEPKFVAAVLAYWRLHERLLWRG
jgi:hypothetical protein